MNRILSLILPCAAVALAAYGQDVKFDFDKQADFAKYRTYKWVRMQRTSLDNQIVEKDIRDNVDAALAAKGLTRTDDNSVTLYVSYQTAVDREKEYDTFNEGWGRRWGGFSTTTSTTILKGMLVIDIYDPQSKQLIWRGTVSNMIDSNPQNYEKSLDKGIAKLFKHYPPDVKR